MMLCSRKKCAIRKKARNQKTINGESKHTNMCLEKDKFTCTLLVEAASN